MFCAEHAQMQLYFLLLSPFKRLLFVLLACETNIICPSGDDVQLRVCFVMLSHHGHRSATTEHTACRPQIYLEVLTLRRKRRREGIRKRRQVLQRANQASFERDLQIFSCLPLATAAVILNHWHCMQYKA